MKPVFQEQNIKVNKDMLIYLITKSGVELKSLMEYDGSIALKYINYNDSIIYLVFDSNNKLILITSNELKARVQFKKLVSENKGYGKNFGKEYGYGI